MKFTFTPYSEALLPIYRQIQETDKKQSSSEFSIPETSEGETGYLALCKEEELIVAAISAVTYDQKQYFLSFWRNPAYTEKHCRILYAFLEGRLRLVTKQSIILSCYHSSQCKDHLFTNLFHRYRYTKTGEETMMEWNRSSTSKASSARNSRILVKACHDTGLLQKLYQSIFQTDKWNSAAYIDSVTQNSNLQMYVLYEIIPPILSWKRSCSLKPVGMCGLLSETKSACLFSFGILPEKRRQGLALEALDQINALLQTDCEKLLVQVSGTNKPAVRLYRTYGFQLTEHVDLYEKHLFIV